MGNPYKTAATLQLRFAVMLAITPLVGVPVFLLVVRNTAHFRALQDVPPNQGAMAVVGASFLMCGLIALTCEIMSFLLARPHIKNQTIAKVIVTTQSCVFVSAVFLLMGYLVKYLWF